MEVSEDFDGLFSRFQDKGRYLFGNNTVKPRKRKMCLAIPAQICERIESDEHSAVVDILGVRRKINIDLLEDSPPQIGEWVLVHVGFAMSKISEEQADEQLKMLAKLGETSDTE